MKQDNTRRIAKDKYDRNKVLFHPDAIASILNTGDTWPVTVNTGFTTYCNHSCVWCSTAYTTRTVPNLKTQNELVVVPEVWCRNVTVLAEKGTKGLIISGQGEPLLHPKADYMLEHAANCGLQFMMFSNGERLSPRIYESLFKGAVAIRFSVDAATPEMHKRWHAAKNSQGGGKSDFEKVYKNIKELADEKRKRGTIFPHLGCQMICSKLTEKDFEAFASVWKEAGVDYVVYKSLQANKSNKNISLSALDIHQNEEDRRRQAKEMLSNLMDIKAKYETDQFQVHVKVDQIEQAYTKEFNGADRYQKCRAHPLTPMMEPDGNVYLCVDHGGNPEFVIGNIYEKNIDEIWESEKRQEVIKKIDLKEKCPAGCFLDETNVILDELSNPAPDIHHALI